MLKWILSGMWTELKAGFNSRLFWTS